MDLAMKKICKIFEDFRGVMEERNKVREELGVAKRAVRELEKLLVETQQLVLPGSLHIEPTPGREDLGVVDEGEEGDVSSGVAEDDSEEEFREEGGGEEGEEDHDELQKKELEKRVAQRLNDLLFSYYHYPVKIGTISSLSIKKLLRLFEERDVSSPPSPEVLKDVSDILRSQNDL
uniref:Uncharacterized protein n=2 Tax=Paramoeba aestuarina TaxID=180227 RepID=A0A7S4JUZ1_9EUKA|mmetsp:Transcript_13074/g.20133  ORF Transcript_13074/g.20133 Transcript_13074/m.20133 type:complete len:176 (+) Transcript_13074:189-716(+)|eukprot:CAMPEP_0201519572 /NCGR_PEP_ID=MMETSP0161_2-20130828/10087_1 /ASSEMBLY_ACC=CAM_ASM_000251 /TAXON_ID=180227 /ORGANISM="Neoparamoeba aestuarina, Strain SoJaBio B1-5/56/2" /LENGTH=175 /DNA_ID=CAMNT_0047917651 /DNA_START=387 /DNA_END=914 /DNA_ORIENTATION=-